MNMKFNDRSEKSRFAHRPHPIMERSYQILELQEEKDTYEPVGEYILLNKSEPLEITEKKLTNLITLLNGKKDLIDMSHLTKTRVLYTLVPRTSDTDPTKVIFKDYDGSGVSKENAVFTIRKGVLYDKR